MEKRMMLFVAALLLTMNCLAQSSLTGRVYHNPNIMKDMIKQEVKDFDKKMAEGMAEAKKKAIEKFEKEKGRKPNAQELADIDKSVNEALAQANAMMENAMKTAVTIEFTDATHLVVKMDMSVDDAILKAAGVSWLKRKAIKAALALAPKSQKGTYVVKGNQIFIDDGSADKDTMTVSADGKYLHGKMDKKTKFTLTRSK